ncbi:sugar phosphate isomerase/epimerase family protein [Bacillus sp. FSL K6-3431]|uniref:sugar phosphate isomerase/epimerase family protein n=1 Tax=Bacillus sp. FSL K6-3431 TaxID=2921500 RepID=UPI0030FA889C
MSYLSISTWSLHRNLGPLRWTVWDDAEKKQVVEIKAQPETIKLKDLPETLASKGFNALEICHFHFQRTDSDYLNEISQACKHANITLHTLLLDYGDISNDDEVRRNKDLEFIKEWIFIAAEVGAQRIRVIAGDSDPEDQQALERSAQHLQELAIYAEKQGVRIVMENFRSLTSNSNNCIHLLHNSHESIRMITDFGNFNGKNKYEELAAILPYSESVHAKANFDSNGLPDAVEFQKCLDLLANFNYEGSITLIYDGPGDMWEGIDRVKKIVEPYL